MEITISTDRCYSYDPGSAIVTDNSAVFRAQDTRYGRKVCLKRVHLTGDPASVSKMLPAVEREVTAMVAVGGKTTHVPCVLDDWFDEANGDYYVIMQWIEGTTLETRMREGVGERKFLQWMIDLCGILTIMERDRFYHKDIKPANIMLNSNDELFLIDFNITLSAPNLVEGTQYYKAPEMDARSSFAGREKVDMFAVGVMLYEFYAGSVPKPAIDYARSARRDAKQWGRFIEPISKNPQMPKSVNAIVTRCMKLDVDDRYPNAATLRRELVDARKQVPWNR